MKDLQQPKYRIGDVVWLGSAGWLQTPVECPDCKGRKVWYVETPAGETFETYCRTCWHGYEGSSGTITDYGYKPVIRRLTIGEVRYEQSDVKAKIQYMCKETGIGSGNVWDEEKLFPTETEARIYADVQCHLRTVADEENKKAQEDRKRKKKTEIISKPSKKGKK